ncbi:unnamed protein product [Closterium sp. Naga37s-1]|nr:unnamed protein product [Closterium sp. Naga37s-1]
MSYFTSALANVTFTSRLTIYKGTKSWTTPHTPWGVARKHSRPYLTVHASTYPPHPLPSTSPPLHIPSQPHPLTFTSPHLHIPSPPHPLAATSPLHHIPPPPHPLPTTPLASTSPRLHIPSPPHPPTSTSPPHHSPRLHIPSPLTALIACRDLFRNQLTTMPSAINADV